MVREKHLEDIYRGLSQILFMHQISVQMHFSILVPLSKIYQKKYLAFGYQYSPNIQEQRNDRDYLVVSTIYRVIKSKRLSEKNVFLRERCVRQLTYLHLPVASQIPALF